MIKGGSTYLAEYAFRTLLDKLGIKAAMPDQHVPPRRKRMVAKR